MCLHTVWRVGAKSGRAAARQAVGLSNLIHGRDGLDGDVLRRDRADAGPGMRAACRNGRRGQRDRDAELAPRPRSGRQWKKVMVPPDLSTSCILRERLVRDHRHRVDFDQPLGSRQAVDDDAGRDEMHDLDILTQGPLDRLAMAHVRSGMRRSCKDASFCRRLLHRPADVLHHLVFSNASWLSMSLRCRGPAEIGRAGRLSCLATIA